MVHPRTDMMLPAVPEMRGIMRACGAACREDMARIIGWHMDVNGRVISTMDELEGVDLADEAGLRAWAAGFLRRYEAEIRSMRKTSRMAHEGICLLKKALRDAAGDSPVLQKESKGIADAFGGSGTPLVGSMIFCYREAWFLARQAAAQRGGGPYERFARWREQNIANMPKIQTRLGAMHGMVAEAMRS